MLDTIETKVIDLLEAATITDVDTDVVQGIDDFLMDWTQYEQYPRVVVTVESESTLNEQIGGVKLQKEYVVGIFLLGFSKDKKELVRQRDVIVDRIERALRSNKRLDNLADNSNTESVYDSRIEITRVSKSGVNESYYGVAWIDFRVYTDKMVLSS
jgi:hypothetical protein